MIPDHCPEGWTREGVACFSATPEKLSFDNAVNRCDQLEGILAEPKTPLQNEYLVNFIKSQPYLKYSSGYNAKVKPFIGDQMTQGIFRKGAFKKGIPAYGIYLYVLIYTYDMI